MAQLFSVVIPLFNKREFVRRAVESVLAQTHRAFELIVVDDGSTDGSHEALASVVDDRFRLIRQANAGASVARNRGAVEARNDWVAFLDADDLWLPDHLAETADIIAVFPDSGFVATGTITIDKIDQIGAIPQRIPNIRRIDYFLEASRSVNRVSSSNVSVSRAAFVAIGGFDERYNAGEGEDVDCWARLGLRYPCAVSDRITSVYMRGIGVMQQLQLNPRAQVVPSRLENYSPSVASVCRAIEADPALARRPGVHAYLNARVFNGVYGALYRVDVAAAASYAKLLTPPYTIKIAAFRVLLLLPREWLAVGLRFARRVKDARRHRSVMSPEPE